MLTRTRWNLIVALEFGVALICGVKETSTTIGSSDEIVTSKALTKLKLEVGISDKEVLERRELYENLLRY